MGEGGFFGGGGFLFFPLGGFVGREGEEGALVLTVEMRADVLALYRRMLLACRRYPEDYDVSRERLKRAFMKNREVEGEEAIRACVERGYFVVKEIEGMAALHKYRTMRKRYQKTE